MKKTFIMNKLFVGLLAFIFLSCSNAIQPKENVEKTDNSPAYICVKSAALSDSSRTALPSTSIRGLSDLVITGNKTGTIPTELARSDTFSELTSNVIEIEPGSWSFTLSANLNGVAFSGTSSAVVVGGQSASLGFLLSSSADDGGFSITVYFDGEADSVTGVIYDTYSDGSPYNYYYLGESMVISNRSRLENSLVIRQNEEGQNYVIFEIPVNENFGLNEGSYRAEITFSKNNVELNTYSTSVQIVNSYISKAVAFMQLCSEPYSITFNLNGGSFPPAQSFPLPKGYTKKMSLLLPNSSYIRKPGYKFLGWYENAELTGNPVTEIPAGSTGNKTFWAKWEENPTVTVYVKQGMSGDGSEGAPFGSIADAVSAISNYPDGAETNFVVKVSGQLTTTQTISGTLNIGLLTIEGASPMGGDENPNDGISASSGNLLTIESDEVQIILKNLYLTGTDSAALYVGEEIDGELRLYAHASVVLDSGVLITGNSNASGDAGGVYVMRGSSVTMKSGSKISNNTGRGVYVGQYASFYMQGGEVSGNTAESGGAGVLVMPNGNIAMGGNSVVNTNNDVALGSNVKILITSELTGTVPVATITPATYSVDTQVIDIEEGAETTLAAESAKFKIKSSNWSIGTDGKLVLAPWNYSFHNNIEVLPAGTAGATETLAAAAAGTSREITVNPDARYVIFGDFPRSHKSEDVTIDLETSHEMGDFTYYLGSDGEWYAEHKVITHSSSYVYADGTSVESNGSTAYFKLEPIKWRILTTNYNGTGKALLVLDEAISGTYEYNSNYYGFAYSYNLNYSASNRTINGKTVYHNNYEYSNARAWLNGLDGSSYQMPDWSNKGFINSAFTESGRAKIAETLVDNSAANCYEFDDKVLSNYDNYLSEDTRDKVFLLSRNDVTNNYFGFAYSNFQYGTRCYVPTDYGIASRLDREKVGDVWYGCEWILRSPNTGDMTGTLCSNIGYAGNSYSVYDGYKQGIVAAICVDLSEFGIGDIGVVSPAVDDNGALCGTFTVGVGKQVKFSKGNLQQKYSYPSAYWYLFAHEQYATLTTGNTSRSNSRLDLLEYNEAEALVDFTNMDLLASDATLWRKLSVDEWQYLFTSRDGAADKCGVAEVAGVNGLVLLPDNWELPSGLSFNSGVADATGYSDKNQYTRAQWREMEIAGAVFLPAAGEVYRSNGNYYEAGKGTQGLYYGDDEHYILFAAGSDFSTGANSGQGDYCSFRLVMDAN